MLGALRSGVLFSSDCFGALLSAVPQHAADLDTEQLQAGQVRWDTIDSPWVHCVDRDAFGQALDRLRAIEPTMVCRSHLPPPPAPCSTCPSNRWPWCPTPTPSSARNHAALEAMLAGRVDVPASCDGLKTAQPPTGPFGKAD
jgi:hypothetical protein